MKRLSVFLCAGVIAIAAHAAPARADCKSEITRMSQMGMLTDPRAIEEYRAAQASAAQERENECRTHLDNAYNYQRANGRVRGSDSRDDSYRFDRNANRAPWR